MREWSTTTLVINNYPRNPQQPIHSLLSTSKKNHGSSKKRAPGWFGDTSGSRPMPPSIKWAAKKGRYRGAECPPSHLPQRGWSTTCAAGATSRGSPGIVEHILARKHEQNRKKSRFFRYLRWRYPAGERISGVTIFAGEVPSVNCHI